MKPLKEFFDARFGSDAKDNEIMEYIIQDYYFRYAHGRSYYEKTIIAIIHKKKLKSDRPTFIPIMVLDRFQKDNENGVIIDEKRQIWIDKYIDTEKDDLFIPRDDAQ